MANKMAITIKEARIHQANISTRIKEAYTKLTEELVGAGYVVQALTDQGGIHIPIYKVNNVTVHIELYELGRPLGVAMASKSETELVGNGKLQMTFCRYNMTLVRRTESKRGFDYSKLVSMIGGLVAAAYINHPEGKNTIEASGLLN